MFKPVIVTKDGRFAIQQRQFFKYKYLSIARFTHHEGEESWSSEDYVNEYPSLYSRSSYSEVKDILDQLLLPKSKWVVAKEPMTINAPPSGVVSAPPV